MVIQKNLLVPTTFLWCNSHASNVPLRTPHHGEEGVTKSCQHPEAFVRRTVMLVIEVSFSFLLGML